MQIQVRSGGSPALQRIFEARINAVLATIREMESGQILLDAIQAVPRYTVIINPYTATERESDPRNASALEGNWRASARTPDGRRGRGTNSMVHFSPGMWRGERTQAHPDEVLYHELCHGLRIICGTQRLIFSDNGTARSIIRYGNVEEFFGSVVTSVYSSQLGRPALANHGYAAFPNYARGMEIMRMPPFSTWINQFKINMPEFLGARGIGRIDTAFNPFR